MSARDFLSGLWAASVSGAVIVGTVWLLRPLFQDRTPRRVFCGLWDAALVRFLIFGELVSPVSVQRWLPELLRPSVPSTHTGVGVMELPVPVEGAVFETAAAYGETAVPAASFWNRETALFLLWLTVALLLAGRFLWTHLQSRRIYGASLPWEDPAVRVWRLSHPLRRPLRVRISDRIAAPLTYGVLRPVILLPKGLTALDGEALSCVLEHEYAHIRRFDTLRKSFLALALCLHWFNPAAWALFLLSNRELELACDEAVTDRGSDKARYARTLLDLEERRGQWGLSGSHFSQNALEERIKAMMREKHRSLLAGIVLIVLISVVVTVFASAAPSVPDLARGGTAGDAEPAGRQRTGMLSAVIEGDTLIREIDGERQYSTDGGETWLSEEGFQEQYGEIDVEWWTAEDYEQWLEEEKKDLQSIIGERGYTSSEGWFTWDQKRVDEAIALYERILEDIRHGVLYSRSISYDGGETLEEGIVLSSGGNILSYTDRDGAGQWPVDVPELLKTLQAFGLSGSQETWLVYNGQRVRILVDGADVGDREYAVNYVYYDPQGELDLHSLRQATPNGDGSYDPLGKLTGLAKRGDRGFDQGLIDCARYDGRVEAVTAAGETSEKLEKYVPFGLQYENAGQLRMYWNGKSVHSLYDTEEGTWFANNLNGTELGEDAVDLETVYENGKLRGLRVSDPESLHTETATAIGNSSGERGRTFEEIFAQYEPYGLLYSPRNAVPGSLSWNGRAVRSFADQKPGGGAFSYEDPYAQDGLRIRTEYDEAGRLTGLKEV